MESSRKNCPLLVGYLGTDDLNYFITKEPLMMRTGTRTYSFLDIGPTVSGKKEHGKRHTLARPVSVHYARLCATGYAPSPILSEKPGTGRSACSLSSLYRYPYNAGHCASVVRFRSGRRRSRYPLLLSGLSELNLAIEFLQLRQFGQLLISR